MAQKFELTREEINKRALTKFTRRPSESRSLSIFERLFESEGRLSKAQRLQIIEQALVLLEMNYAHLPLKRARHAVDPIQRLKRLKFLIEQTKPKDLPSEMDFHKQMQAVFISTRDNHTNYSLPAPFKDMSAFLPFLIEEYFVRRGKTYEPKYLVSRVARRFLPRHLNSREELQFFKKGVEVLYWNGIPIKRAIELNAEKQAGSNDEARFARGLDSMTIRPFNVSAPPDERWVFITYRTENPRSNRGIKLEWRVFKSKPSAATLPKPALEVKNHKSMDPFKSAHNYIRWDVFPETGEWGFFVSKTFRAKPVILGTDQFAYIRILSFHRDDQLFVTEFRHLLRRLTQEQPEQEGLTQRGLIIDVRGNGGGFIEAGERLLQLFTPRKIRPALFEFLNSPLNVEISKRADRDYKQWSDSIIQAADTGAIHSRALPITSKRSCNDIGQVYYGPVVLITDALCYSTTDIFAAGFQDHKIGEILGASGNTGAGGATVVKHEEIVGWMKNFRHSPYKPLPKQMSMRVSLLRSLRVRTHAGRPLEELGVKPNPRYYITKNDLLNNDQDLIHKAVEMLKSMPTYSLSVRATRNRDGKGRVIAETANISRLDVYVNDHPYEQSRRTEKKGDRIEINNIPLGGRFPKLVIEGYSLRKLVARFKTRKWSRS